MVDTVFLVAVWLFAITHMDTLLVLVAFCVDDAYHRPEILVGHYLGFTAGLVGAIIGALLAAELLQGRTFLLGFLPLSLGILGLIRRRSSSRTDQAVSADGPVGRVGVVASAGLGLSGENLALFVPFFAELAFGELVLVTALYLVAAGGLYLLAVIVAQRTAAIPIPDWIDRWLVPVVLTMVGLYVLMAGWILA